MKKFSGSSNKLSRYIDKEHRQHKKIDPVSKRTIDNFFNQSTRSVNLSTLDSLCFALLDESSYVECEERLLASTHHTSKSSKELSSPADIASKSNYAAKHDSFSDEYIFSLLKTHSAKNLRRYNSVKILTMDEPLELDKVYVDVNLLRRKTKREILIDSVDRHSDFESFEDVISSTFAIEEFGVDSFHALKKYQHLMVWGGLGTGKTTFLKTIATQDEKILDKHPVFIELRTLAEKGESILDAIQQDFHISNGSSQEIVEHLLEEGRLAILLDGLDEVSKYDFKSTCKEIEGFVNRYPFNQFVVSCRYGIYDYGFRNFTEVEVAKLSEKKIVDFIHRWFDLYNDKRRGEKIISLLQKNKLLRDFASTPLMLNMLCLNVKAGYGMPENTYSVYDKAVKASAEKWDQNRFIDRDRTKLTTAQRLSFLSDLAFDGLYRKRKKYTWDTDTLRQMMETFIKDSGHYDQKTIVQDCDIEIKAIEGYHSLLERTSDDVYRFSTPAFQHYFTADYAESSRDRKLLQKVVDQHILDKQWREIFVMLAEKLKDASELVLMMFKKASMVADIPELQELLYWTHQFTKECNVSSSSWRSGVMTIDMELDLQFSRYSIPSETRTIAHQLALSSRELNRRNQATIKPSPDYILRLALASALALAEDQAGSQTISLTQEPSEFAKVYLGEKLLNVYTAMEAAMKNKHVLDQQTSRNLQDVADCIPRKGSVSSDWKSWARKLQSFMVNSLEIGQNIELSSEASRKLADYLYIQEMIVGCLLINATIKSEVRDLIRHNLVMPNTHLPSAFL